MFDQLMDGMRKASESSLQMQQEMFRNWTRQWLSSAPGSVGTAGDGNRGSQRRWLDLGLEMLNKHREAIDATYRAGIQIIEQTLHLSEAKSPDDYRKLVEDLWRRLSDLQKGQAESQFRDVQSWFEKSAGLAREMPQA